MQKKRKKKFKIVLTKYEVCCNIHFVAGCYSIRSAQIAQLVEQRTENPRVAGSIPALGITHEGFTYMRV